MNRKMLLLNLVLLALVAGLLWTLRGQWREVQSRVRALRERQVQAKPVMPPPAPEAPKPVVPAQYFEVADKTLFSRDRNPSVLVDPAPAPPAPPPMPDLPFYSGQMALGEPVVFLSTAKIPQRSYHAGDTIADFRVVGFDRDKMVFEFKGKTIERPLSELRPKETTPASQSTDLANGSATNNAPPAPNAPSALTLAKPKDASGSETGDKTDSGSIDSMLGPDLGGGQRACVEGDNSPSGTVHNGYKKVSMISLLGPLCHWEQTK